jgi:hypothetical protein
MKTFEYRGFTVRIADDATPEEVKSAKRHVDQVILQRGNTDDSPAALKSKQWKDKVDSAWGELEP